MRLLRINFYLLIKYHILTFPLYCLFMKRISKEWFKTVMLKTLIKSNFLYTGCPRRNVPEFGRVFLMLKYTDITQNTYVQI